MRNDPGQPQAAPEPEPDDNVIHLAPAKRRLRSGAAEPDPDTDALMQALKDVVSVRRMHLRKPLPLLTPPAQPVRFVLHVELVGSKPPIWRRLSVPSDLTLDRLHGVLQTSFGWTDSHLHQFTLAADPYGQDTEGILTPFDVAEGDVGVPECELRLDQFLARHGDTLHYTYDFEDDWELLLALEAVDFTEGDGDDSAETDASVRCIAGRRKAPPEGIGGIQDYEFVLAVAANPRHPSYTELFEYITRFDLWGITDEPDRDAINRGLDRPAGEQLAGAAAE